MTTTTTTNDKVFDAENAEADTVAFAVLNAHKSNGGVFHGVSWKHEGRFGPVYIGIAPRVPRDGTLSPVEGRSFAPECPACGWPEVMHSRDKSDEGTLYLGWMSRAEAKRLARWASTPLSDA